MRVEETPMYQAAELLMREVDRLMPRARRMSRNAADHMERSCESVLFNIAEGLSCFQPKVKLTAYNIARKEAHELRAILRRLYIKGVFTESEIARAINLVDCVIGMLTNAMIAIEKRMKG